MDKIIEYIEPRLVRAVDWAFPPDVPKRKISRPDYRGHRPTGETHKPKNIVVRLEKTDERYSKYTLIATRGSETGRLTFSAGTYGAEVNGRDYSDEHVDGGLSYFLDRMLNGTANAELNSDPSSAQKHLRKLVSACETAYPTEATDILRMYIDGDDCDFSYFPADKRVRKTMLNKPIKKIPTPKNDDRGNGDPAANSLPKARTYYRDAAQKPIAELPEEFSYKSETKTPAQADVPVINCNRINGKANGNGAKPAGTHVSRASNLAAIKSGTSEIKETEDLSNLFE